MRICCSDKRDHFSIDDPIVARATNMRVVSVTADERTEMHNSTTIEKLDLPALIIHTGQSEIRNANDPARQLWGLADDTDMPVALDPDMPALAGLAPNCTSPDDSGLVFWTLHGAQRLRCSVQALADAQTVLVIFEEAEGPDKLSQTAPHENVSARNATTQSGAPTVDMRAMAHELRTPLGAIIALAEMIDREQFGPVGDPRYRDYARDIGDSAKLTLGIVASALEKNAHQHGVTLNDFAELNVAQLIGRCLRTVGQIAGEAGVALHQDIAEHLPNLIADATGLSQIVLNLLTNAIKFTPQGGAITVAAHQTMDGGLMLEVKDTGVGMTDIDASVLVARAEGQDTEANQTTIPGGKAVIGSQRGIGFPLVRRLAAAMSADFNVESRRGVGTHASLIFPPTKVIPVASTVKA